MTMLAAPVLAAPVLAALFEAAEPPPFDWSYVTLAVLVVGAILVFYLGNFYLQNRLFRLRGPQGRRLPRGVLKTDPQFAAFVGRALARGYVTKIAEASAQPIMIRGTIAASDGNLGGAPGRECVWRNRSDAPRDAAIAAEMVVIADATGRVTLENVELAEVIATEDKQGTRSSRSLYLGDEVEVIGRFKPERFGQDPDPTRLIYGSMGGDGQLHIRVAARPTGTESAISSTPSQAPPAPAPAASEESPE